MGAFHADGPTGHRVNGLAKNVVVCCDGTGNQIESNLSNVLKLFRVLEKSDSQVVYYDPGVGTIGHLDPWARFRQKVRAFFDLATGRGLDDDVLDAYRFLIETYADGDAIYLFGYSRGAYTVRVLAGFIHMVGLLPKNQANLAGYAFTTYKQSAEKRDFKIAWQFRRVTGGRRVPIKFIGVWDTVSSVLVPRADRLYVPSMRTLPYTRENPSVAVFRHAAAIDERRRMFRLNRWVDAQPFKPHEFSKAESRQDVRQVWFAGVHGDIGGGYPEKDSGLSKFPLEWMISEAARHGLRVHTTLVNRLVKGHGRNRTYVAPDPAAPLHNSMTIGWKLLEFLPKHRKWKEGPDKAGALPWYIPSGEARHIPPNAILHWSVIQRRSTCPAYRPPNLPKHYLIEDPAAPSCLSPTSSGSAKSPGESI